MWQKLDEKVKKGFEETSKKELAEYIKKKEEYEKKNGKITNKAKKEEKFMAKKSMSQSKRGTKKDKN